MRTTWECMRSRLSTRSQPQLPGQRSTTPDPSMHTQGGHSEPGPPPPGRDRVRGLCGQHHVLVPAWRRPQAAADPRGRTPRQGCCGGHCLPAPAGSQGPQSAALLRRCVATLDPKILTAADKLLSQRQVKGCAGPAGMHCCAAGSERHLGGVLQLHTCCGSDGRPSRLLGRL